MDETNSESQTTYIERRFTLQNDPSGNLDVGSSDSPGTQTVDFSNNLAHQSSMPTSEIISNLSNSVFIMTGEPGMGKTKFLQHYSNEYKDSNNSVWVCRFELNNLTSAFKVLKDTEIGEREALTFLAWFAAFSVKFKDKYSEYMSHVKIDSENNISFDFELSNEEHLNMTFFRTLAKDERIALLFDGFSEICPEYKEIVLKLLKIYKDNNYMLLLITTRPTNDLTALETRLATPIHQLYPWSKQDQKDFLNKHWASKLRSDLNDAEFDTYSDVLFETFEQLKDGGKFLAIPLHTKFIADATFETFRKYHSGEISQFSEELAKDLNWVDLFYKLFNEKLNIRFVEKAGLNITNCENITTLNYQRKTILYVHTLLAVNGLFGDILLNEEDKKNFSEQTSFLKENEERTGFVDRIIDGKAVFFHRYIQECFAGVFLCRTFKELANENLKEFIQEILIEDLVKHDKVQISRIFQLTIEKENDLEPQLVRLIKELVEYLNPLMCKNESVPECCKIFLKLKESLSKANESEAFKKASEKLKNILFECFPEMRVVTISDKTITAQSHTCKGTTDGTSPIKKSRISSQ